MVSVKVFYKRGTKPSSYCLSSLRVSMSAGLVFLIFRKGTQWVWLPTS